MKVLAGENGRNPEKTYLDSITKPRNPHGVSTPVVPWLSYSPLDSFGKEVKLWHVKETQAEIRASEQNLSDFSRSL